MRCAFNRTLTSRIANEILAAAFGRAGYQSYYERDMLNNIGFVIFDTINQSVRIAGV